MSISAEIIADSVNPKGCRLTTFILEYPRFIHSETLTHRVFSRNAASSRAIPIEKMIQQVIDNPAMPVWWGKNQSGMQAREELSKTEMSYLLEIIDNHPEGNERGKFYDYRAPYYAAQEVWLKSRDKAIDQVRELMKIGLHKQIANRILEPWFNIRVILSGTEFENFYKLRAHPDAQPEFQNLAYKMKAAHEASAPKRLKEGEWHIPFGDKINEDNKVFQKLYDDAEYMGDADICSKTEIDNLKTKIAIARCARVSYFNFEGKDDYEADIKLCDRLFQNDPKHLSPTEHVAQATNDDKFYANFRGFKQYRSMVENQ